MIHIFKITQCELCHVRQTLPPEKKLRGRKEEGRDGGKEKEERTASPTEDIELQPLIWEFKESQENLLKGNF